MQLLRKPSLAKRPVLNNNKMFADMICSFANKELHDKLDLMKHWQHLTISMKTVNLKKLHYSLYITEFHRIL